MRRPPKLEWMGLMDVVGPFVTPAIVADAFPNGLEGHDSGLLKGLRSAYKSWEDSDDTIWHREWVNVVLTSVLGYQEKHILQDQAIPDSMKCVDRTHHTTIRPTFIIHQPEFPDRGRILVMRLPKGESTSKPKAEAKWQASPISQMQMLLQANNEKIGLVTNGEEWVLVNNCGTGAVGFATWYAYLWLEEQDTLRSFRSLLSIRRVFGAEPGQRLPDLLARGAEDQQDVTDRLGYQVRRAVEELVGALERLDRDSNRELLKGVSETEVYEGVLTVMMRLVFLFCAEERGLLHLGEDLYDRFYAVSTLREQLHDDASKLTEEVLDRRSSAWCRLLATFRMVYQGVAHEDLRIPAYGGTLFDPDRFPWLEGRQADGTNEPPHVSDRIVLHLLDSLQVLRQGQEARKLSFHALDVEQIGHVYEGLLDHTAKRALNPVLGLVGKEGDEPEVDLELLESKWNEGQKSLVDFMNDKQITGRSERALTGLLGQAIDAERLRKLRVVCGDDQNLFERVKPFANLVREDSFGNLQVFPTGALYATTGSDRRSTGTHYTPRTLTEEVVKYALEPLVYVGPAEGLPEEEWTLKEAKAIVDLKVCDMAMGSGAFLVAACRFLSVKLVEAWAIAEEKAARRLGFSAEGHYFTHRIEEDHPAKTPGTLVTTPYGEIAVADPSLELIPSDADERLALARRIIADRCLYGVDRNAMAVEMAKLSLWLTTLRKDRPFTFLDHALRHGDSLLGVTERQLEMFSMDTSGQSEALLLPWVPEYVGKVRSLRQQIAHIPSHDPEAIRRKQQLFEQARELERPLKFAADALVACELSEGNARDKTARRAVIQSTLMEVPAGDRLRLTYRELLGRPTFHWELEFPDVFAVEGGGFNAIVGNPPFLGGTRIRASLGLDILQFLLRTYASDAWSGGRGDLCAYFLLRANAVCSGSIGLITTNSICEGDTREIGLGRLLGEGASLVRAVKSLKWPGEANLEVSLLWLAKSAWRGQRFLDSEPVETISASLIRDASAVPNRLVANMGFASEGTKTLGMGFVLTPEEASTLLRERKNGEVVKPFLGGENVLTSPVQLASRFVIDFTGLDEVAAAEYASCWEIIQSRVRPERQRVDIHGNYVLRQPLPDRYWQFGDSRAAFYGRFKDSTHFICVPQTSKYAIPSRLPNNQVFSQSLVIIGRAAPSTFAILSSEFHALWIQTWCSRLESRIRYLISDGFETFPMPGDGSVSDNLGDQLLEVRSTAMQELSLGLTDLYNRFHEMDCSLPLVKELRSLHRKIDIAVSRAYGWGDVDLEHGFHETSQGIRFTISPEARKEVLRRLLKLNHERYAEEEAAGLHPKKGKKASAPPGSTPKRGPKPKSAGQNPDDGQLTIGDMDNE